MLCIFQRHVQKCFSPSKRPFAPNEIVSKLKVIAKQFRQGRQEDSHEFIRLFVDALVKPALHGLDHLDHASKDTTLLHQIFGGHLVSQIHCLSCGTKSNTFEPFLDLSLEIRDCSTLEKALSQFTKSETLNKKNQYKCDK
jgi:ubiquitin C-terminal hydrolase